MASRETAPAACCWTVVPERDTRTSRRSATEVSPGPPWPGSAASPVVGERLPAEDDVVGIEDVCDPARRSAQHFGVLRAARGRWDHRFRPTHAPGRRPAFRPVGVRGVDDAGVAGRVFQSSGALRVEQPGCRRQGKCPMTGGPSSQGCALVPSTLNAMPTISRA